MMQPPPTAAELPWTTDDAAGQRASPRLRLLCLILLVGGGAWFGSAGYRMIRAGAPDFEYFYKSGRYLLTRGALDPGYDIVGGQVVERGTLEWYWPFVPRVMTLFALLPQSKAGYVWLGLNLLAMFATWRLIGQHVVEWPRGDWPVASVLPVLCLAAYWLWEFRLNQINNFTLLLMVGSFVCWQRGRPATAGLWLGLAVLLKLTPGLLVLWFALKRQFRVVAVAVLTVVLAGPVADLVALGPGLTGDAYRRWLHDAVLTGSQAGLVREQCEMDWRNQGLGAVLSRWLHPTNYNTHFDNDPRVDASYGQEAARTLNVVSWPLATVEHVVVAVVLVTLGALIWLARRSARTLTAVQLRSEWALFLLAMLWLMPVMRRYHMIWATPAAYLLLAEAYRLGWRERWSKLALACVGVLAVSPLTLLFRPLEAGGTVLAAVLVLALPLLLLRCRRTRAPATGEQPAGGPAPPEAAGSAAPSRPAMHHV